MRTQGFPAAVIHLEPAFDAVVIGLLHGGANQAGGSRRMRRNRIFAKRTGSFSRALWSSTVAAPAEKICRAPSKRTGCSEYSLRSLGDRLGQRNLPSRLAMTCRKFTDGPEFLAVPKAHITHVTVEVFYFYRLHSGRPLTLPRSTRQRPNLCALRASSPRHAPTRQPLDRICSGSRKCAPRGS